jgi:hypothetical protein
MIALQTAAEAEQFLQEHQNFCNAKLYCLSAFEKERVAKRRTAETPFADYVSVDEFMMITQQACQKVGMSPARFYELNDLDEEGLLLALLLRAGGLLGTSPARLMTLLEEPCDVVDEVALALVKSAIGNAPKTNREQKG